MQRQEKFSVVLNLFRPHNIFFPVDLIPYMRDTTENTRQKIVDRK